MTHNSDTSTSDYLDLLRAIVRTMDNAGQLSEDQRTILHTILNDAESAAKAEQSDLYDLRHLKYDNSAEINKLESHIRGKDRETVKLSMDLDNLGRYTRGLIRLMATNIPTMFIKWVEQNDPQLTHKINAIKAFRAMTGYGLKEAKDFVDAFYPTLEDRLDYLPIYIEAN